ncbi:MAG: 50S ribosomal protein L25 [Verrucomicrobia bacterium]|nr:50S ribosomal protein L25 [Verrucomicrobiota bacterium]
MKSVSLTAYPRAGVRRAGLKKVRRAARIPAVIYGRHNPPQNLEIGAKDMEDLIHASASENILLDLSVADDPKPKRLALVQEVQHHALSGKVLHVDLHEVVEDEKVNVNVPLETLGEAIGVKTGGGILEHVLFRLKVRALPKDLPEAIQIDVSNLELGKSIHIGEIKAPEGVEILGDKKIVVISVAVPKTEAQEAAEEAAAAAGPAEPEMIKEKKEEGAAPAAEKGAEKAAEKAAPEKAGEKPEKKAEKKK